MSPQLVKVPLESIDEQRRLGWPDFDAEDYCHRCGCRNITWSIESDRFNLAMGSPPAAHQWNGIICPACFVELHEAATGLRCSWSLVPLTHFHWIQEIEGPTNERTTP